MPDQLFDDIYRDTADLTWAPIEQVRRRGRRRIRRTRIATALASVVAVAVIVTGAAALADHPDGPPPGPLGTASPTPSATTSPSPTADASPSGDPPSSPPAANGRPNSPTVDPAIPAAAMLQMADLPKGFRFATDDVNGDWSVEAVTIYCQRRSRSIMPGEMASRGAVFASSTAGIIQRVTRHLDGKAEAAMDWMRELVTGCVSDEGDSLSIVAEGLGGDESLMVRSLIAGLPSQWLIVRQGDLVSQVTIDSDATPGEARHFARLVADRLCAGTDAC